MGNSTYINGVQCARTRRRRISVDEKRLVVRLKSQEEAAFTQLVRLHKDRVYSVCLRMLANTAEAEDIAQEVFVRAFMSIRSFREEAQLSTWLYRIAVNLCKNRLKYHARRHYKGHRDFEGLPDSTSSRGVGKTSGEASPRPDEILEGSQAETRIQQALMEVDPDYRQLLILRDIQGRTYLDIMKITGLPEGTVKSRLHRARSALRKAYDSQQETGTNA